MCYKIGSYLNKVHARHNGNAAAAAAADGPYDETSMPCVIVATKNQSNANDCGLHVMYNTWKFLASHGSLDWINYDASAISACRHFVIG